MSTDLIPPTFSLPEVAKITAPILEELTTKLRVDREVLASDEQIQTVWQNLPQILHKIPPEKRDEGIVRMCVALASGLFDCAVNYVWNATVVELRQKVNKFGLPIISEIFDKKFGEKELSNLSDYELLNLCLKLNLITEYGHKLLNQCRETRNNFSVAHPPAGPITGFQFLSVLDSCNSYAFNQKSDKTGIEIKELINALLDENNTVEKLSSWNTRIDNAIEVQQVTILKMLHGIYCDFNKEEFVRSRSLNLCNQLQAKFSQSVISGLINQHQMYQQKGLQDRYEVSQLFFKEVGLVGYLSDSERHVIISSACKQLMSVHNALDNFYNEPYIAKQLANLSTGHQIPETARDEYVETVLTCAVGSPHGVSYGAAKYYQKMIMAFTPQEIRYMLQLPNEETIVGDRIKNSKFCKGKYQSIISSLNSNSIPADMQPTYNKWLLSIEKT